ncbi:hypothetical protein ES705_35583 [subsurface metagenome]
MRPQESIDYSGLSQGEALNSMYGVNLSKAEPLTLREAAFEVGMMIAMPFVSFGLPLAGLRVGGAIAGSRAYKSFQFVKRPVLSMAVNANIRGAQAAMSVSKTYGKLMLGLGIIDIKRNVELARQREFKRLGINLLGPLGSLWAYNNYMAQTSETDQEIKIYDQAIKQSRIDASLTSASKTRGKKNPNVYTPKSGRRCRKGYVEIDGKCVKRNSTLHRSLMK